MLLILTVIAFLGAGMLTAQTATPPASGDGTSGDPYQIATLNNLYWITQNSGEWNKYYEQTADIDASGTSGWDGNAGFYPIGDASVNLTQRRHCPEFGRDQCEYFRQWFGRRPGWECVFLRCEQLSQHRQCNRGGW